MLPGLACFRSSPASPAFASSLRRLTVRARARPFQTYLSDNRDVMSVKMLNHDEDDQEIYLDANLTGFENKMRQCALRGDAGTVQGHRGGAGHAARAEARQRQC